MSNRMLAAALAFFAWGYPTSVILAHPDTNTITIRWDHEPNSFLGIKFNVPLKGQLPGCDDVDNAMCLEAADDLDDMGGAFTSVSNPPDLGFDYYLRVFTVDSKVAGFTVKVPYNKYPTVHQALAAKYGQPTSEHKGGFRTNDGQDYDNLISDWKGEAITIELAQRDEFVTQSTFWVTYKALDDLWLARKKAADAKSAGSAASKM